MARALEQIMAELNSVYNPQRDVYNKQLQALPGQQQAQMKGLEAAKQDSFQDITTQANRRGVAFGGIPLEEQGRYLGSSYLPAVANLKNRFEQNKFTLQGALAEIAAKQAQDARGIWQWEMEQDRLREAEAARARAASGGGGGGGFGLGGFGFGGGVETGAPVEQAPQLTLRQTWQQQANAGDWQAQTLLNYVGDDGRYDGHVNSQAEYDILKNAGVQGNFYVAQPRQKSQNTGRSNNRAAGSSGPGVPGLGLYRQLVGAFGGR